MTQELPARIQQQLDEANEIERIIAEEQAALAVQKDTPAPAVVPETPPALEVVQPVEPVLETPAPVAVEEPWEARFRTLEGKYKAEVPRLNQQLKEAKGVIAELQSEVSKVNAAPQAPAQTESLVTSEDEEAFGTDLIAVMKKVVKQETAEVVRQTEARVKAVAQKVDSVVDVQAETANDKFFGAIEKAVPDWEAINSDNGWLEWLGEYSPETGAPRQAALDAASQALDSTRTIALFNLYKSTKPVVTPSPAADKSALELQSQVAPAKAAASAALPVTDKIWSGDEYERAFDVRLTQTMTEEEVTQVQNEAERAYQEGRIRW